MHILSHDDPDLQSAKTESFLGAEALSLTVTPSVN